MSRFAVLFVLLGLGLQSQAQMFSHGIPAGATSPQPDGRQNGVPASVLSPTPIPPGVHFPRGFNPRGPLRRFGSPHERRHTFVPVPIFIPAYGYNDAAYPVADPYVLQGSSDPAPAPAGQEQQNQANAAGDDDLRQAYLQGARDALKQERDDVRYGEHYLDSRERERSRASANDEPPAHKRQVAEAPAAPPKQDNSPATVFIFKDGHQLETHNFAIMGQTLYDFSGSTLKKVELTDLNKDATTKANDDRGITVKLP